MTYRLQMQGEGKRLEREQQGRMAAVWHTSALPRMKPFPSFGDFTGIKAVLKKLTPAEMRAKFQAMREDLSGRS